MWKIVLELDQNRKITSGSGSALADAIRGGADLWIYIEFRHIEHVDVDSPNAELCAKFPSFA